jgi:hypothetical protein
VENPNRTVSGQMSMPRSKSRSSTFRRFSGNRTYNITAARITSGEELKYRNGLAGSGFVAWVITPDYRPRSIRASLL